MPQHDIRFGGTTFSFMWTMDALSAMRKLRDVGLNDFDVITVPGHFWHEEIPATERLSLRRAIEGEGIRMESLNVPALDVNLASCVDSVRRASVDCYSAILRLSADLGAKGVVVVPGRVSGLLPPERTHSISWLSDSMDELLRVAESTQQTILMEAHPQTPIPRYQDILGFLARFPQDRLKVAYDVANAEFIGEDQREAIVALSDRLGQLHLSDATRTSWKHDAVGKGTVDFEKIIKALEHVNFEGVTIVEVISANAERDTAESLTALQSIVRQRQYQPL